MMLMRSGSVRSGTVILAELQFTDTSEIKTRPAVVLFEERGNIVVAGITSNANMHGILLTRKEGAVKDSVIKLNYLFTISEAMIKKQLFMLTAEKHAQVVAGLVQRLRSHNV